MHGTDTKSTTTRARLLLGIRAVAWTFVVGVTATVVSAILGLFFKKKPA